MLQNAYGAVGLAQEKATVATWRNDRVGARSGLAGLGREDGDIVHCASSSVISEPLVEPKNSR